MAEPKTAEEAIAQARKERPDPTDYTQVVLGQIADALIGIRWALLSSAKRSAPKKKGDVPLKPLVPVANEEEAEEYRKNNPNADVNFVITGVPRAKDSYVKPAGQTD
jgi:hypothetical protein